MSAPAIGTACAGCGTVYLVYEQALYDTGRATGNPVGFFCADCHPGRAAAPGSGTAGPGAAE